MGLSDGEGMERLWSYLRLFNKMTKEMTPEHRTDLLVDALLHHTNKVKVKLGRYTIKVKAEMQHIGKVRLLTSHVNYEKN